MPEGIGALQPYECNGPTSGSFFFVHDMISYPLFLQQIPLVKQLSTNYAPLHLVSHSADSDSSFSAPVW